MNIEPTPFRVLSILVIALQFKSIQLQSTNEISITNDRDCPPVLVGPDQVSTACQETTIYKRTACDSDICGGDKMCQQYHELANNLQYYPYLRHRDVTDLTRYRPTQNVNYDQTHAYVRDAIECNQYEEVSTKLVNDSSFSPWEYVINRDDNRIPRDILETQCVCARCLNGDRRGVSSFYQTRPIMVTRYFNMKNNGTTVFNAKFSYGCICEFN